MFEIETIKNNIKLTIDEGKKQLVNYWIAEIEDDIFGDYEVKSFAKAKENGKVKAFLNLQDGEYVLQVGKMTSKDTSRRAKFKVENGEIIFNG